MKREDAPRLAVRILTIGHSTREPGEFLALLDAHGVSDLVDVRTVPRSRHVPWASRDALPSALAALGMRYHHLAALGGLRKARSDSPNAAWRNASFRGYADHMQTPAFEEGLDALLEIASEAEGLACIMCAEAVPWRCHRSLVADALLARGIEVDHVMDGRLQAAKMTPFAKVRAGRVTYPAEGGEQTRLAV